MLENNSFIPFKVIYYLNYINYMKTSISIFIPNDLRMKIDSERGDIPRSKFIVRMIEQHYLHDQWIGKEK